MVSQQENRPCRQNQQEPQKTLNGTITRRTRGLPARRPSTVTADFISTLLGMTTVSQSRVSIEVPRQRVSCTRPSTSPMRTQSPTAMLRSACRDTPPMMLPSVTQRRL